MEGIFLKFQTNICVCGEQADKLLHISGHCTQSKGGSAYGYMGILSLIFTIEHS